MLLEVAFQKGIQILFPFCFVLFSVALFAKNEKPLPPDFEVVRDGESVKQ